MVAFSDYSRELVGLVKLLINLVLLQLILFFKVMLLVLPINLKILQVIFSVALIA